MGGVAKGWCMARRVFISYAQESDAHVGVVRRFWDFLRRNGVDARMDWPAAQQPRDWALWMAEQVREADVVLCVASAEDGRRAEGRAGPAVGRGVQWEARLIRDQFHAAQDRVGKFVSVVVPGQSRDGVPDFLAPSTSTVFEVAEFTVAGAEELLRYLLDRPEVVDTVLGPPPDLRAVDPAALPLRAGPRRPLTRRRGVVVGLAFVAAVVIGAGCVVAFDALTGTRTADSVMRTKLLSVGFGMNLDVAYADDRAAEAQAHVDRVRGIVGGSDARSWERLMVEEIKKGGYALDPFLARVELEGLSDDAVTVADVRVADLRTAPVPDHTVIRVGLGGQDRPTPVYFSLDQPTPVSKTEPPIAGAPNDDFRDARRISLRKGDKHTLLLVFTTLATAATFHVAIDIESGGGQAFTLQPQGSDLVFSEIDSASVCTSRGYHGG